MVNFVLPVTVNNHVRVGDYESFVENMFTWASQYGWTRDPLFVPWANREIWVFRHPKQGQRLLPMSETHFSKGQVQVHLRDVLKDVAESSSASPVLLANRFGAAVDPNG